MGNHLAFSFSFSMFFWMRGKKEFLIRFSFRRLQKFLSNILHHRILYVEKLQKQTYSMKLCLV